MGYYIRQQKKYVSGPHDVEHIRLWIQQGKVREEMEFSTDQIDWIWGIELPNLFEKRQRRVRRAAR